MEIIFLRKNKVKLILLLVLLCGSSSACKTKTEKNSLNNYSLDTNQSRIKQEFPIKKSAEQWKKVLTEQQYYVLREQGTERAFTGKYDGHKEKGIYYCAGCGQKLFSSKHKFDSGSGWPSYYQPVEKDLVGKTTDNSLGMIRTEVHCSKCGGHLGHIFPDGPKPTGLRYCINSISLTFKQEK